MGHRAGQRRLVSTDWTEQAVRMGFLRICIHVSSVYTKYIRKRSGNNTEETAKQRMQNLFSKLIVFKKLNETVPEYQVK